MSKYINQLLEDFDRSGLPQEDRGDVILEFAQKMHSRGMEYKKRELNAKAHVYLEAAHEALVVLSKSSILYVSDECIVLRKSLKAERDELSRTDPANEPPRPDLTQHVAKFVRRN